MATKFGGGISRRHNVDPEEGRTTRTVTFSSQDSESDSGPTRDRQSTTSKGSAGATFSLRRDDAADEEAGSNSRRILLTLKIAIGLVFFVVVLVSSVLSKLTLVSLTDALRSLTWMYHNNTPTDEKEWKKNNLDKTVSLYWQLLLVLLAPNCLTFLRCLFFGVLGKTRKSYPWPTASAAFLGVFGSLVEVMAMCTLIFLVLTELSPGVAILVLNGVFIVQTLIDIPSAFRSRSCGSKQDCNLRHRHRAGYRDVGTNESQPFVGGGDQGKEDKTLFYKCLQHLQCFLEYYVVKVVALILQVLGVAGLIAYCIYVPERKTYFRALIGLPLVLLALSAVWCNRFQEAMAKSHVRNDDIKVSARYKSSLINSGVRLCMYPFVSYIVFRYLTCFPHFVDPWCLHGHCNIVLTGETLNPMIVHIVLSFVGYCIVWISCTMTLSQLSVGVPLLLSTPIAAALFYIVEAKGIHDHFFPHFYRSNSVFEPFLPGSPIIAILLWIGEFLALGFYICAKTNIILAKDKDMFLTPHYDSIFLEQYTILNRQVHKGHKKTIEEGNSITSVVRRNPRMIFICSTMYRESEIEMKQMLKSLFRVARHCEKEWRESGGNAQCLDKYESHIFFDGAINANQIENFGLQLLSLLKETLNIELSKAIKKKTPYGYCLSWNLGVIANVMPFNIHFKDKTLVKPKKRWSQVMYMNYVINYRIKNDNALNADDTFILTTDADIDFKANSVVVLLDMLASNSNVAAVCARTHPKGQGIMYWYQVFDYAIGHWFQKPAEHILGSVLCSPGCFSAFRCSSLKMVLDEYSTEATGASEFLMKDMGEDRWLCTLLIKKGLRLEYCAISEDLTYCPMEFDEFFKQRRRWIPSTIANLVTMVSESNIITRGNDSISILYILFQIIIVFSTAISPATVILVVAAGLQPFGIPLAVPITILSILSVVYGLICLYASPKTQLDVSKLLTFFFALIMSMVIVGIIKDTINSIFPDPDKIPLVPGNCDKFETGANKTEEYYQCMKGYDFAANYTNGLVHHFTMPVSITVVYLGLLAFNFTIAGLFHPNEFHCLMHSIWYLLGLPSGYLLLLIYSAANLCDRSWGTREQNSGGADEGLWGWRVYFIKAWRAVASSWCCVRSCFPGGKGGGGGGGGKGGGGGEGGGGGGGKGGEGGGGKSTGKEEGSGVSENPEVKSGHGEELVSGGGRDVDTTDGEASASGSTYVEHVPLDKGAEVWLKDQECGDYTENFTTHGYNNLHFIASMTQEDFEAIGIDKRGFRLRLEKSSKQLKPHQHETGNHMNVDEWLKFIELGEYAPLFHREGYKWQQDFANMKDLNVQQLKDMGITKRAHLQRLEMAIKYLSKPLVKHRKIDNTTLNWLTERECEEYVDDFEKHGYTNNHFLAGIKAKDLEAIGVDKKGLRLRLEKAAQHLPPLAIKVDVPDSVEEWLRDLDLSEYTEVFHKEGYKNGDDMVNLKGLDEAQLKAIGITKKAHLQRMRVALTSLAIPSAAEIRKRRTKVVVENDVREHRLEIFDREGEMSETKFWTDLINRTLKPVPLQFMQNKDVQKSLESLRNSTLALLLLVNLMWIVLLMSLEFWQLQKYEIDPRAFQLLFLAVYGFIIIVQFFTMIAHRCVTLIHYLGRVRPRDVTVNPWKGEDTGIGIVSMNEVNSFAQ